MNYSKQQLESVQEYAGQLLKPSYIAALLDVPEDELRRDLRMDTPVGRAYRRGKAATALELHRQEIELAKVGSPLGVAMAAEFLRDMNDDEDI